jgi:ankyrin repeat protein
MGNSPSTSPSTFTHSDNITNDTSCSREQDSCGSVHAACHAKSISTLTEVLRGKADPNERDSLHNTPLHVVCQQPWCEGARILVQHGGNVAAVNYFADTPLHVACRSPNASLPVAQLLLDSAANAFARNGDGATALHVACQSGAHHQIVSRLLESSGFGTDAVGDRDEHGSTALHLAACASGDGAVRAVRLLLEQRADVEAVDQHGDTPLHCCCRRRVRVDVMRELLAAGSAAAVHRRNRLGRTPLHYTAALPDDAAELCADLLLCAGASANERDHLLESPLHVACRSRPSSPIAHLLVRHGASLHSLNVCHSRCFSGCGCHILRHCLPACLPACLPYNQHTIWDRQAFQHTPIEVAGSDSLAESLVTACNSSDHHHPSDTWHPNHHHQSPQHTRAIIETMLMIRNVPHEPASILLLMPNELMFEIFSHLPLPSLRSYCMLLVPYVSCIQFRSTAELLTLSCYVVCARATVDRRMRSKQLFDTLGYVRVQQLDLSDVDIDAHHFVWPCPTLLHTACKLGREELARHLICCRADINIKNVCRSPAPSTKLSLARC